MTAALAALFFLGAPAAILFFCSRVGAMRALGPIVLCYALGLAVGLSGLLPEAAQAVRVPIMEGTLAMALPLLLFSVDVRAWGRVAGRAMLSMGLAVAAVVCVATALFYQASAQGTPQPEQLSGMAIGMYTGGIANLGAIKLALAIPDARYLLFATVDTVIGAMYLLFVLTFGVGLARRFLPAFAGENGVSDAVQDSDDWRGLGQRAAIPGIAMALGMAAVCVGAAVVLAPLQTVVSPDIAVIVLLTSFGLAASFIPAIRRNISAPTLGMYLIFVFSLCVAAGLDLSALANLDGTIFWFVTIATVGSVALHALLCRVFRVDADTFLITSVAALMSPAFVPMVVRSLGNRAVLISGMATGILGFAIGNYLGIAVALLLGGSQ